MSTETSFSSVRFGLERAISNIIAVYVSFIANLNFTSALKLSYHSGSVSLYVRTYSGFEFDQLGVKLSGQIRSGFINIIKFHMYYNILFP